MVFYLYKITNNINGKIYIGVHETRVLPDTYMGSGKHIISAIRKYGVCNFSKEILATFETRELMYEKEADLVNEEFVRRRDTYNIALGGSGASITRNRKSWPKGKPRSDVTKKRISNSSIGKVSSAETKILLSTNNWAKRDPVRQREHAKLAGAKASKNPDKLSASLKAYFANNESACKGIPKTKIECPHCLRYIAIHTANRWHFDNCKTKLVKEDDEAAL